MEPGGPESGGSDPEPGAGIRLRRRHLLVGSGATLAALAAGGVAWSAARSPLRESSPPAPPPERPRQRPNIVLIVADDLGWGESGCYGSPVVRTPNIDRLAAEGVRFTDYYAGAPVCAPSRCSLLTGMHVGHARVRQNPMPGGGPRRLEPEDITIGEVLHAAGYRTGLFGKWGLSPDVGRNYSHPNSKGFDEFFGGLTHSHARDYYSPYQWENDTRVAIEGNLDGARGTYLPDVRAARALEFIDRHRDEPFFVMLSDTQPHTPHDVPTVDPEYALNPKLGDPERRHCSQISRLDRYVGDILAKLTDLDLVDNTVVLLTSDNGPHEEHGFDPDVIDANGPLRGYKRNLYEGGIRVPMVAWSPYLMRHMAGQVSGHVWAAWDVLPTLAALAGAPVPSDVDGLAMDGALTGAATPPQHESLYFYRLDRYTTARQNVVDRRRGSHLAEAVRRGSWKALRFSPDRTRTAPAGLWAVELYDLARDPGETRDLAVQHPTVAARLVADMKAAWVPEPFRRAPWLPEAVSIEAPWYVPAGGTGEVRLRLANHSAEPWTGVSLRLTLPPTWTAEAQGPTAADVVAPGEAVEAAWVVTLPATAPAHEGEEVTGVVDWRGADGRVTDRRVTTTVQVPPAAPGADAYLSDLQWMQATGAGGPIERDTGNGGDLAFDGRALRVGGYVFTKGLGCHAPSDISYHLGGAVRRFTATVGVDDEVGSAGSVVFQVWGDGRRLFDSGRLSGGDGGRPVDIDVSGVRVLALVTTNAGDGTLRDHADWAEARVYV
jgi:arylsulfatase A-like enzyme